jgi:signal transduction histidine kinase
MKWRLPARSLRVRLVVAFGLGALALCVVLAAVTFGVTRSYLLNQREGSAERQAQARADTVAEALRTRGARAGEILSGLRSTAGTQSLLHLSGQWYTSSVGVGPNDVSEALKRGVEAGISEHQRVKVSGNPVLVIGIPIASYGAQYYEIAPLSELNSTLHTLSSVLIVASAGVTIFGAALGFWTSRRLLSPLTRVASISREIAGGRLDARIGPSPDRELATLSAAFNDMADALQERIHRERRFTADVSHELRSPLTVLSASVGALEARRDELSERSRTALDLLSAEIRRFSQLVEDLLEISRMDAGTAVALEPVCLAQIVLRAQMLGTVKTPIRIEVDADVMYTLVLGDKRRLERIVANLLDNADRYAASTIEMHLRKATLDGERRVLLTVDDDGPGVPEADRQRIFDRFARSAGAGRRGDGGGAGLGLALVRQHVDLHRGSISVATSHLGGARFSVDLPEHQAVWDLPDADVAAAMPPAPTGKQS